MRIVRDPDSFTALRAELTLPLLRLTNALNAQRVAIAERMAETATGSKAREADVAYLAQKGWVAVPA